MTEITKEQIANLLKIQSPDGLPKAWLENQEIVAAITGVPLAGQRPTVDNQIDFKDLEAQAKSCTNCVLHQSRKNVVFGTGNLNPDLVFVGEGPSSEEDLKGKPFFGKASELLAAAIEKGMKLKKEDVYLCNVVKCRPPNNRAPLPEEIQTCSGYLEKQLKFLNPKVIVALGNPAMKALTKKDEGITKVRGQWLKWNDFDVMPTFHPAYILRNPDAKKDFWNDLKLVMTRLGIES